VIAYSRVSQTAVCVWFTASSLVKQIGQRAQTRGGGGNAVV
jgi:hypothetical protein